MDSDNNEYTKNYVHMLDLLKKTSKKEIILDELELLNYIIDIYEIKFIDICECITINEFLNKSYNISTVFKYIINKYNIECEHINQHINKLQKIQHVKCNNCYHQLVFLTEYDSYNKCNIKCKKCGLKYNCLFCHCVASVMDKIPINDNFNHSIIETKCENCNRNISQYICKICLSNGCYCGCYKDCICE